MEKNVTGMDELLAGYAAGTLTYPAQALVGAHLELSDRNRGYVSSLETLAGVGLETRNPSPCRTVTVHFLRSSAQIRPT